MPLPDRDELLLRIHEHSSKLKEALKKLKEMLEEDEDDDGLLSAAELFLWELEKFEKEEAFRNRPPKPDPGPNP